MARRIHAFQIFYNDATKASLDPDFEPLDNSANERPDWYEYWPMRSYFSTSALAESAYYGFFSPLFFRKTQLGGKQVMAFASQAGEADAITFSPHPCHGACFYNVFEQGANCFPGFLDAATRFLHALDPAIRLDALVNDSRNTVYSNYFLAKPRFWSLWNGVFNRLFELAETPGSPLHEALTRPVEYAKDDGETKPAQMKIMVMERVVSLMLASGAFKTRNYPPFPFPSARPLAGALLDPVPVMPRNTPKCSTADGHFRRHSQSQRTGIVAAPC